MLKPIQAAAATLTRAERKVAEHVLAHPQQVLRQPIAAVAEAAGVSEPTVIRFCRTLGCQGFQDFKLRLAQDLATGAHTGASHPEAGDSAPELIGKVVAGAIGAAVRLRDSLPVEAVDRAIDLLVHARHIAFFGLGGSGLLAVEAQRAFLRLGVPAVAYPEDSLQAMAAALLGPGSAVVTISRTGRDPGLLNRAGRGRSAGASIIAVCPAGAPLAERADVCLPVGGLDPAEHTAALTRVEQRLVLDILAAGLGLRRGPAPATDPP